MVSLAPKQGGTRVLRFAPIDTVRVNLEAFADHAAEIAPHPVFTLHVLANVAAFDAIVAAIDQTERWQNS
jgi:hypothetical protein